MGKNGTLIGEWVNGEQILSWGVQFWWEKNGENAWHEDGDERKHSKYVGELKNGEEHGQGTVTSPNGNKFVGEFKNGKMHNGNFYFEGEIISKVVNGKYIKQ